MLASEIATFYSAKNLLLQIKKFPTEYTYHFIFDGYGLKEIPFNEKEKNFFVKRDVEFSQKFEGTTPEGTPFTLLLVSSRSWSTHHNPEICLQGIGYRIDKNLIVQINHLTLRDLTLNDGRAHVEYWFTHNGKTIADYSERIWEGIFHPSQVWTLVEVGLDGKVNVGQKDVQKLIFDLESATKKFDENFS